jgi:hypothetical protein
MQDKIRKIDVRLKLMKEQLKKYDKARKEAELTYAKSLAEYQVLLTLRIRELNGLDKEPV